MYLNIDLIWLIYLVYETKKLRLYLFFIRPSIVLEDNSEFNREIKDSFELSFHPWIVLYLFLRIIDLDLLDKFMIKELYFMTWTGYSYKLPDPVWLVPQLKQKINFRQLSTGFLHLSADLNCLLPISFFVNKFNLLFDFFNLMLVFENPWRNKFSLKDPTLFFQ